MISHPCIIRFMALCAVTWWTAGCASLDSASTSGPPRAVPLASQEMLAHAPAAPFSVEDEIVRLRATLARDVPQATPDAMRDDQGWIERAGAMIARSNVMIDHPQLLVVVDRAPSVQQMVVMAARPGGRWEVIGGTKVSTGRRAAAVTSSPRPACSSTVSASWTIGPWEPSTRTTSAGLASRECGCGILVGLLPKEAGPTMGRRSTSGC